MSRQPTKLLTVTALMVAVVTVAAGCEAKVYGTPPPRPGAPQLIVVAPLGSMAPLPEAPPDQPSASFSGLESREHQATSDAADAGAKITALVLDRNTGRTVANGNTAPMPIASVAKLFIADDLLLRESEDQAQLSPADRQLLDSMLRSSDDNAANVFWNRGGGNAIITRVAARYGLTSTTVPYDENWWNTMSTAADLVRFYDGLLDGSGGLPPERASIILSNLAQSTPTGVDGYPQRFGIPNGLSGEPVAVKQGWMCCWDGGNWMHMSTGVIGPDRRYIMVIGAMQPTDEATARDTITQAVKTMFPAGHI